MHRTPIPFIILYIGQQYFSFLPLELSYTSFPVFFSSTFLEMLLIWSRVTPQLGKVDPCCDRGVLTALPLLCQGGHCLGWALSGCTPCLESCEPFAGPVTPLRWPTPCIRFPQSQGTEDPLHPTSLPRPVHWESQGVPRAGCLLLLCQGSLSPSAHDSKGRGSLTPSYAPGQTQSGNGRKYPSSKISGRMHVQATAALLPTSHLAHCEGKGRERCFSWWDEADALPCSVLPAALCELRYYQWLPCFKGMRLQPPAVRISRRVHTAPQRLFFLDNVQL